MIADRTAADEEAIVADEAHISARSRGGPRYGEYPPNLVDDYDNLILLCRVDHKRVDDQPNYYKTALLRQLKREHEAWVAHILDGTPEPFRYHFESDGNPLQQSGTTRIDVDLPNRVFAVTRGQASQRFKIPSGAEIRVTDMQQVIETAASIAELNPTHWWKFHHNQREEVDSYTTTTFSLSYMGDLDFRSCYIQWQCDAEGCEDSQGHRGDGSDDWLGGIITDQPIDSLSYNIAGTEEEALRRGYSLEGSWYVRVVKDADSEPVVQFRILARWSKPSRWKPYSSTTGAGEFGRQ